MGNYVAAPSPILRRFSAFPIIALLIVTGLGFGGYYLFRNNIESQFPKSETAAMSLSAPPSEPEKPKSVQAKPAMLQAQPPPVQKDIGQVEGLEVAAVATLTSTKNADHGSREIRVDFGLLDRDGIQKFNDIAQGHLEIGRLSTATFNQGKFPSGNSMVKSQGPAEFGTAQLGQSKVLFSGGREPKSGDPIGFFIEVVPTKKTDDVTDYKISIRVSLPDMAAGEVKIVSDKWDEGFSLPNGNGFAVAGLLPRKTISDVERDIYADNVLKALLSPEFQKGDDEFVVFVYPRVQ